MMWRDLTHEQKTILLDSITEFKIESGILDPTMKMESKNVSIRGVHKSLSGSPEQMVEDSFILIEEVCGQEYIDRYIGYLCSSAFLWIDIAKERLRAEIEKNRKKLIDNELNRIGILSENLADKLTSRPYAKDGDGLYDFYKYNKVVIEIIQKYLMDHFRGSL